MPEPAPPCLSPSDTPRQPMNKGSRCREFSAPALISRHLRQPLSGSEDPESPGAKQAQGQSRTFGVYRASVNPKGWRLRPEGAIAKALAPAPAKRKGCRVPSDRSLRVRPASKPESRHHTRDRWKKAVGIKKSPRGAKPPATAAGERSERGRLRWAGGAKRPRPE